MTEPISTIGQNSNLAPIDEALSALQGHQSVQSPGTLTAQETQRLEELAPGAVKEVKDHLAEQAAAAKPLIRANEATANMAEALVAQLHSSGRAQIGAARQAVVERLSEEYPSMRFEFVPVSSEQSATATGVNTSRREGPNPFPPARLRVTWSAGNSVLTVVSERHRSAARDLDGMATRMEQMAAAINAKLQPAVAAAAKGVDTLDVKVTFERMTDRGGVTTLQASSEVTTQKGVNKLSVAVEPIPLAGQQNVVDYSVVIDGPALRTARLVEAFAQTQGQEDASAFIDQVDVDAFLARDTPESIRQEVYGIACRASDESRQRFMKRLVAAGGGSHVRNMPSVMRAQGVVEMLKGWTDRYDEIDIYAAIFGSWDRRSGTGIKEAWETLKLLRPQWRDIDNSVDNHKDTPITSGIIMLATNRSLHLSTADNSEQLRGAVRTMLKAPELDISDAERKDLRRAFHI